MIGIVSDTHGLLRPQVLEHLQGSELIIHAGDVGDPDILEALRQIAPVVAVRGNIDTKPPLASLPEAEITQVAGRTIYTLHNIAELGIDPVAAGIDVVVFGHSHKAENFQRKGVMYINPGSIGPRRFRLPITLALLDTSPDRLQARFITLNG